MCSVKSVNNAKDALNHNFESYQHFCIPQLKNSDTRLFKIRSSNIKLLPPLKTPTEISSTCVISDLGKKDFSSANDFTDDIKYSQCDVSTKYVQRKVSVANNEIDKLENEKTCDSKLKAKSSFLDILLRDDIKDCQNHNLKKDIQCIKMADMNLEIPQNSSFQSKCVTETKQYGSLNKPLKIHDSLLCESLKGHLAQNIVQSDNVPDRNLKKEENVAKSSEAVSKYWEKSINNKDFESNRDKCKVDTSNHRCTFLKHDFDTKTITSYHLDETSEQKSSGIWFEVPW